MTAKPSFTFRISAAAWLALPLAAATVAACTAPIEPDRASDKAAPDELEGRDCSHLPPHHVAPKAVDNARLSLVNRCRFLDQQWSWRDDEGRDRTHAFRNADGESQPALAQVDPAYVNPDKQASPVLEDHLRPGVVYAFETMMAAFRRHADEVNARLGAGTCSYAYMTSGYRSFETQRDICSIDEAWCMAGDPYHATPQTSEHHLGRTVDITVADADYALTTSMAGDPSDPDDGWCIYRWLKDNAHRYGFVESYPHPDDRCHEADARLPFDPKLDDYGPEPWHWRHIGSTAATEMHERGLCRKAYLAACADEPTREALGLGCGLSD